MKNITSIMASNSTFITAVFSAGTSTTITGVLDGLHTIKATNTLTSAYTSTITVTEFNNCDKSTCSMYPSKDLLRG